MNMNKDSLFDEFLETHNALVNNCAQALVNALVGCDVTTLGDNEEPAIEEDMEILGETVDAIEGVLDSFEFGNRVCRPYYSYTKVHPNSESENERIPCYLEDGKDSCPNPDCPFRKILASWEDGNK